MGRPILMSPQQSQKSEVRAAASHQLVFKKLLMNISNKKEYADLKDSLTLK